jgi:3-phosphoshikimate 1-carboxyvinyltransferase
VGARLSPPAEIRGVLTLPGSKSFANRALIASALASGRSEILNSSFSEDTRLMAGALIRHGMHIDLMDAARKIVVDGGRERAVRDHASFFLGNAGTAVRFLTAYLCLHEGKFVVDGDLQMRRRPVGDLIAALNRLGGEVRSVFENGCPPISIRARGLRGGSASIKADVSSQFVSAILLASPCFQNGVELELESEPTSRGYVDMTLSVLGGFGIEWSREGRSIRVPPQNFRPSVFVCEPDAAAANYFFAAAAATGGRVRIDGLGSRSVQSERRFVEILRQMGCQVEESEFFTQVRGGELRAVDVDLNDAPDSVQTLAVLALFARGSTTIRNVANLRVKETDRLRALATELGKLGARVRELPDGLAIDPPERVKEAEIASHGDHRMVMSFAIAALKQPGITLENPGCVAKSFPEFFDTLHALGVHATL